MSDNLRILCTGGSGFIGIHLVDAAVASGYDILNLDILPPKDGRHIQRWNYCDILDDKNLTKQMLEFSPTHVIHLAAHATMEGRSLEDFKVNVYGTKNVLDAIHQTPSVKRVIITSTQHVRKPGSGLPKHDEDFAPLGLYGQSKVITEQLIRKADLHCTWIIIRPTTIWGPFHPFLPNGLWRYIAMGYYLHPSNDTVLRAYGYVKNTTWQILGLLQAPVEKVHGKVFYLADALMYQKEWVNAFSKALRGRHLRTVPKALLRALALFGDMLGVFGVGFPMHSERYRNLTTQNPVPIEPILDLLGLPPVRFDDAVAETVNWLKEYWRNT